MTVAELIAELSKIEDKNVPVVYLNGDYGIEPVIYVDLTAAHIPFGPSAPYVRLW